MIIVELIFTLILTIIPMFCFIVIASIVKSVTKRDIYNWFIPALFVVNLTMIIITACGYFDLLMTILLTSFIGILTLGGIIIFTIMAISAITEK